MKNLKSLNYKFFLLLSAFCFLPFILFAQDKITLTWNVDDVSEAKEMALSSLGAFTVNWGDGTIETISGYGGLLEHLYQSLGEYDVTFTASDMDCHFYHFFCNLNQMSKVNFYECSSLMTVWCTENQLTHLDLSGCEVLKILYCEDNQITNLNLSGCTDITNFDCSYNQISNLNLSECTELQELYCSNNQLTSIILPHNNVLQTFSCSNNRLQLSDLYIFQTIINDFNACRFGYQYLLPLSVSLNTELFADQSVFEGVFTKYTVEIDGMPAPVSNFAVIDGKLIFYKPNNYTVTMTNDVVGSPYDPAKVIIPIEVVLVGVKELEELEGVRVFPNPTTGELRVKGYELGIDNLEMWKFENVEIFDIYGKKQPFNCLISKFSNSHIDISHLPAGVYFVKINTEAGEVLKKVIKQ